MILISVVGQPYINVADRFDNNKNVEVVLRKVKTLLSYVSEKRKK